MAEHSIMERRIGPRTCSTRCTCGAEAIMTTADFEAYVLLHRRHPRISAALLAELYPGAWTRLRA